MLNAALRGLVNENLPYDVEFKIRRPDTGEIIDIHSVAEYDHRRNVVFGIIQDITGRKSTEEELRESRAFLNALLDAIPTFRFLSWAGTERNRRFNRAFETFFGAAERG